MAELESALRSLEVEWPPTPDVAGRLELVPRRRRVGLAVAVALAAAVLVAAFAVPQSRSAILRFFHLGGVTVQRVNTLPRAEERPLASGLGEAVDDAGAQRILGRPFLPRRHGALYARDGFVSTLVDAGGPALLSEFGAEGMIKKLATSEAEFVEIAPRHEGLWIAGAPHVVFFGDVSPRLAGNVLVWTDGNVTFRLEGKRLTQAEALRIARTILGTDSP